MEVTIGEKGRDPGPDQPTELETTALPPIPAPSPQPALQPLDSLLHELNFPRIETEKEKHELLEALHIIDGLFTDNGKLLKPFNLRSKIWTAHGIELLAALDKRTMVAEVVQPFQGEVALQGIRDISLDPLLATVTEYSQQGTLGRFFNSAYSDATKALSYIVAVPNAVDDQIKVLQRLIQIAPIVIDADRAFRRVEGAFIDKIDGESEKDPRFWYRTYELAHALCRVLGYAGKSAAADRIHELLADPAPVYARSEQIALLCADAGHAADLRQH